ncbi:MAG: FadR family transcriptional regulator [Solirubrobacterales bacterium]|nr:FadR family transcriptional regulator [Solirubrobacterales bacterium]
MSPRAERRPVTKLPERPFEVGHVSFGPIEQLRSHEYVAEQLRRQIGLHIVPTGEALPTERNLAAMFGVGRATVQAAIRLLDAERLVETRRGRHGGTFVIGLEDDDSTKRHLLARLRRDGDRLDEALVFRTTIEPFAAFLAAENRSEEHLEHLRAAHASGATADTDPAAIAHDTEFHLALGRAAGNLFVYDSVERLRLVLSDALTALPDSKLWRGRSEEEHSTVLRAIERGDAEAASHAMRRHVDSTHRSVRALLAAL